MKGLENLSNETGFLIAKARDFATAKHSGQFRKFSRSPYIVHPQAVACFLASHGFRQDENLIAAAWCHDVIEDSGVTRIELTELFNFDVAELVHNVSHPLIEGNRATRQKFYLEHYQRGSIRSKTLKLADRICNLNDYWFDQDLLSASDWEYLNRVYLPESRELASAIGEAHLGFLDSLIGIINYLQEGPAKP